MGVTFTNLVHCPSSLSSPPYTRESIESTGKEVVASGVPRGLFFQAVICKAALSIHVLSFLRPLSCIGTFTIPKCAFLIAATAKPFSKFLRLANGIGTTGSTGGTAGGTGATCWGCWVCTVESPPPPQAARASEAEAAAIRARRPEDPKTRRPEDPKTRRPEDPKTRRRNSRTRQRGET